MNRILVIESEQLNRKAVRDILKKKGFDVVTSPSGREGIRTVREAEGFIAVCIADNLTGLSGLDTLIAIRKYRPHIPVIMLMKDTDRKNILRATRRGASDFVHKPVKATELLLALRNTLEKMQLSSKVDRQLERLKLLEKSAGELTSIDMGDLAPEDVIRENEFLKKTLDLIAEVLEAKKVSLMLLDKSRDELVMAQSNWMPAETMVSIRQPISKGVAGWVASHGKPILTEDAKSDKRTEGTDFAGQYDSQSFICTPLFFKKKVIGTISANDKIDGEPFNEGELTILNTFAHQASMAIANLSMNRKVQREHLKLTFVNDVANGLISSQDPEEIYRSLTERTRLGLKAAACGLLTLDSRDEGLRFEVVSSDTPVKKAEEAFEPGKGIFGKVMAEGIPAGSNEPKKDKNVDLKKDFPPGLKKISIAACPLKMRGKVIGILAVYNKDDGLPFNNWDIELLMSVAPQAAMALKNAWLHQNLINSIDEVVATNRQLEDANKDIRTKIKELDRLKRKVSS